jgi:hypothetical protein
MLPGIELKSSNPWWITVLIELSWLNSNEMYLLVLNIMFFLSMDYAKNSEVAILKIVIKFCFTVQIYFLYNFTMQWPVNLWKQGLFL